VGRLEGDAALAPRGGRISYLNSLNNSKVILRCDVLIYIGGSHR